MKNNIRILSLTIIIMISGVSYSMEDLFSPKKNGVSDADLQNKLDIQRSELESELNDKLFNMKAMLTEMQEVKTNELLKRIKGSEPKTNSNIKESNKELTKILKSKKTTTNLNNEFGENGLVFVGIINNQKVYKNNDGNYIIKGLNFDFAKYRKDHKEENQNKNQLKIQ